MATQNSNVLYGGIEAGGTKFVCGIGTGPDDLQIEVFDTLEPGATLDKAIAFFQRPRHLSLAAIGIGSFGPVHLNEKSLETYGSITPTTPKQDWRGINVVGRIGHELGLPIGFDTDVNAAALGEHRWGAAHAKP